MTDRQPRLLSFTEVSTALTCWAQWDFAYGGRLAGTTLKPKELAPALGGGRAWGAAVAAWHQNAGTLLASWFAHDALRAQLDADAQEMIELGFDPGLDARMETETRLGAILDHYIATAEPFPNLTKLEAEIVVPVPSRGGKQGSTRYRFQCFLDGFTDDNGEQWLVEFKLRGSLTPPELLLKQRQPRWYGWAYTRQQNGHMPTGVYVDERLNAAPGTPRTVQGRKKGEGRRPSHDKAQVITPESYIDLCHEHSEEPHLDVVEHLRQRQWQQRFPLSLRPSEMEAAGNELRDAAKLIRDLDSGELTPIRNASRAHCGGCKFRTVCAEPTDELFVDALFKRTVPKRLRTPEETAA
jgi:hypothetical protein